VKTSTPLTDSSGLNYNPFGMTLVGRNFETGNGYRYGFNTQEQDDEIYGNGNLNTAEFWEYDTRLGRRWNVDPVFYAWQSGYSSFDNNPILITDLLGLSGVGGTKKMSKRAWKFAQKVGGTVDHADKYQTGKMYVEYAVATSKVDANGQEIITSIGVTRQEFTLTKGEKALNNIGSWFGGRDSWVHSDEGEEFGRSTANMFPAVGASNILKGMESGSDIYNIEMDGWDYVENGLAIIPGEGAVGQKVSVVLRLGKYTGKILTATQVAKRLNVSMEYYHRQIKPEMKKQFSKEAKELNTTNPDFTPDDLGNVVVVNPVTKETISTNVPFNSFKD